MNRKVFNCSLGIHDSGTATTQESDRSSHQRVNWERDGIPSRAAPQIPAQPSLVLQTLPNLLIFASMAPMDRLGVPLTQKIWGTSSFFPNRAEGLLVQGRPAAAEAQMRLKIKLPYWK